MITLTGKDPSSDAGKKLQCTREKMIVIDLYVATRHDGFPPLPTDSHNYPHGFSKNITYALGLALYDDVADDAITRYIKKYKMSITPRPKQRCTCGRISDSDSKYLANGDVFIGTGGGSGGGASVSGAGAAGGGGSGVVFTGGTGGVGTGGTTTTTPIMWTSASTFPTDLFHKVYTTGGTTTINPSLTPTITITDKTAWVDSAGSTLADCRICNNTGWEQTPPNATTDLEPDDIRCFAAFLVDCGGYTFA